MKTRISLFSLIVTTVLANPVAAQEFSLGADVVSRYVWRGIDFGNSASIQPSLEFSAGKLVIGTWASYAMSPVSADASEHDLYLSYTAGPISIGVTDYYFPNSKGEAADFFNFENPDGAHVLEPFISFNGVEGFPVTILAAINAYNEADQSIYLNASIAPTVQDVDLSLGAGFSARESEWYATGGFSMIDLSIGASKSIPFTNKFKLPVFVQYILNPTAERSYLVFGFSL